MYNPASMFMLMLPGENQGLAAGSMSANALREYYSGSVGV